jgi:hypothetical protein
MLLLWWCPYKIQKEKRAGLQFTSTDYLSLLLTPLRIHRTIPLSLALVLGAGLTLFCYFILPSSWIQHKSISGQYCKKKLELQYNKVRCSKWFSSLHFCFYKFDKRNFQAFVIKRQLECLKNVRICSITSFHNFVKACDTMSVYTWNLAKVSTYRTVTT